MCVRVCVCVCVYNIPKFKKKINNAPSLFQSSTEKCFTRRNFRDVVANVKSL